jgi:hypothetical protein
VRRLHDNSAHCQTTARGTSVIAITKDVLHDNEKTEQLNEVFPSQYTKDYVRRVTGRLQTSASGTQSAEGNKTRGVCQRRSRRVQRN